MTLRFSVVVPAHNEESLLPGGLAAIEVAADHVRDDVEVIVVANRCTDATADLARSTGAVVVEDDSRNLSAVRNAGAAEATGEILVTVDLGCGHVVGRPLLLRLQRLRDPSLAAEPPPV